MAVTTIALHGLSDAEHRRLTTWGPEIAAALRPGASIFTNHDEVLMGSSLALRPDGGWCDHEAAVFGFGASTLIVHLGGFTPSDARKFAQTWLRDHPATGRFTLEHISEAAAQARAQHRDQADSLASRSLPLGIDHLLLAGTKVWVTATGEGGDAAAILQSAGVEALRTLINAAKPAQLSRDGELRRLASLGNVLDYETERKAAARRLNVRVSRLDLEVTAMRELLALDASDNNDGQVTLGPEPWHEAVNDIAAVLNQASDELARYVIATREQRDAAILWALHSHFVHHTSIYLRISPRLAIPGCGTGVR